MKKLIALTLALVLCLGLGVTALADTSITQDDGTGSTQVKYDVSNNGGTDNTYIVTIPAAVAVDAESLTGTITVAASDVKALSGYNLIVTVTSANSFTLKNEESSIAYTLQDTLGTLSYGNVVFSVPGQGFLTAASGSATLTVTVTEAAINAATAEGKHTDTLTFKCTCRTGPVLSRADMKEPVPEPLEPEPEPEFKGQTV